MRFRKVVEVLEDLEVRDRGAEMERRGGRDRAADVVGRDEDVVRLRPGRELSGLGDPSAHRRIRLDDVCRLELEQLAELVPHVDALTGRDRDLDPLGHLLQRS